MVLGKIATLNIKMQEAGKLAKDYVCFGLAVLKLTF